VISPETIGQPPTGLESVCRAQALVRRKLRSAPATGRGLCAAPPPNSPSRPTVNEGGLAKVLFGQDPAANTER